LPRRGVSTSWRRGCQTGHRTCRRHSRACLNLPPAKACGGCATSSTSTCAKSSTGKTAAGRRADAAAAAIVAITAKYMQEQVRREVSLLARPLFGEIAGNTGASKSAAKNK